MSEQQLSHIISTSELLEKLFTDTLSNTAEFDSGVVELVKTHLGVPSPHSKAGQNLAMALIELAKNRASGGQQ